MHVCLCVGACVLKSQHHYLICSLLFADFCRHSTELVIDDFELLKPGSAEATIANYLSVRTSRLYIVAPLGLSVCICGLTRVAITVSLVNKQIFQTCLEDKSVDSTSGCRRDLTLGDDRSRIIEFVFSLTTCSIAWTRTEYIKLTEIALTPLQIAEAIIRDQNEELATLRSQLHDTTSRLHKASAVANDELRVTKAQLKDTLKFKPLLLDFTELCNIESVKHLDWKRSSLDSKSSSYELHPQGWIKFRVAGSYQIHISIKHRGVGKATTIALVTTRKSCGAVHQSFPIISVNNSASITCEVWMNAAEWVVVLQQPSVRSVQESALKIELKHF